MLRTTCVPCRHGHHYECQGGQKPPTGVMGGWKCVCDHTYTPGVDLIHDLRKSLEAAALSRERP
jgi:hypothetical protein